MLYDILIDDKIHRLELQQTDGQWHCRLDGEEVDIDAVLARRDVLSILLGGKAYEVKREQTSTDMHLWVGSARYNAEVRDPRSLRNRSGAMGADHGPRNLISSMPGKVVRVLLQENDSVEAGQGVLVVEAMKMQNEIKSPKKGIVQRIVATQGATVNAGDVLAIIE